MRRPREADRLRRANPAPLEDAPSPDSPQATALFERIVATDPGVAPQPAARRQGVLRRRIWVILPATLLAAAAGYGLFRRTSQPLFVACYGQQSLAAPRALVPTSAQGPAGACSPLWQPGAEFNPEGALAPALTASVLAEGTVGVFPGRPGQDPCSALGLAQLGGPVNGGDESRAIAALQTALSDRFLEGCVGPDQAAALVRTALTDSGLEGWRVLTRPPFTSIRPCGSLAFDVTGRTITVVPVAHSASP